MQAMSLNKIRVLWLIPILTCPLLMGVYIGEADGRRMPEDLKTELAQCTRERELAELAVQSAIQHKSFFARTERKNLALGKKQP